MILIELGGDPVARPRRIPIMPIIFEVVQHIVAFMAKQCSGKKRLSGFACLDTKHGINPVLQILQPLFEGATIAASESGTLA